MFLGDSPVSWKAEKQKTTSKSSVESEYRTMFEAASELVWIERLLRDLHVHVQLPI